VTALADTSLFIAREQRRAVAANVPDDLAVSVVTVGELFLGVILADDPEQRTARLRTVAFVQSNFEPLPVDEAAAHAWADLVGALRRAGRRAPVNDAWIAAIAISRQMPVVTQDDDYDAMPGVAVIRV
jgi:predicted nucleic acid-binding protein